MEIRKVYDKRGRAQTILHGHSLTKQSFKDECDINQIIAKAVRTGVLPEGSQGLYSDVSDVPSYQESLELVKRATEQFEALPAKLRKRLNNDPQEFLSFVHDPENIDELVKYGLAVRQEKSGVVAVHNAKDNKARVEASASTGQPAVGEGPAA